MPGLEVAAEGRYIGESQLTNTNDADLELPSTYVVDARASWSIGPYSLTVFGFNLNDSRGYSTGNVSSGGAPRYFVLAPPSVQVILRALF
jgi:outer membrane receptor protein involved in Fe transport